MGEYQEGNLLGYIKHDLPEIHLDGTTPERLKEYFRKQEALMIEYRIGKIDLCFRPMWETLDKQTESE